MKRLLLLTLFLLSVSIYSQREANFWYFGDRAALDFNSGTPVPVTGSQLSTTEGCSSFADSNGDLLFYVGAPNNNAIDLTIWNRNNQPMPNGTGIRGDASSSQSALTIPAPGQPNIYYLFVVGAPSSNTGTFISSGFWFYTIDMNADGGLGDIVAGPIELHDGRNTQWTEKVTAVRANDCNEFWVISFVRPGDFYAYKVNASGVDRANPVISSIPGFNITDPRGYLKVSPDGTTLVSANMNSGTLLFDFDDATGMITHFGGAASPQALNIGGSGASNNGYGVEFSVSSRRLYVSTGAFNGATEGLFQFDLTQPTFTDINNSRVTIHTYNNTRGALQLAGDNKIYWTSDNSTAISVINDPEELGAAVNYSHQTVNLGGATATQGLPPFLSSLLLPIELTDSNTSQVINNQTIQYCLMDNILIQPEPVMPQMGTTVDYEWSFDDGTTDTVVSVTTDLTINNIQTTQAGDYTLTVTLTDSCGNPTKLQGTFTIEVYNNLTPMAPSDINFCDVDGDGLNAFDFQTDVTPGVLNGQDPALIEAVYYPTETDARDNIVANQLANPHTPTAFYDGPIWVRVHNIAAPNACNEVYSFNLQITGLPVAQTPTDIIVCDGDGAADTNDTDGFHIFDLTTRTAAILGSLSSTQYNVTYHTTAAGANADSSTDVVLPAAITNYQNPISYTDEIIYVRVENVDNANCYDANQSFTLTVNRLPTVTNVSLLQCDDNSDLISDVNLTLEQPNISTNSANETFEFYTTRADAVAGSGASLIPNPVNHNASDGDTVFVRTISTENCDTVSEISITISFAADVPYNRVFIQCDDFLDFDGNDTPGSNDDTDGLATFDFSDARTEILAFFPIPVRNDLDVKFFETIADRASEINELTNLSSHRNNNDPAYANNQTIYAKIINTVNNDCTGLAEFTLEVTPVPTATPINADNEFEECDNFVDGDATNGIVQNFDLDSLIPTILGTQNPANYTVTFHETAALAASGMSSLASPYTNITRDRQTIYVRVAGNGCAFDRYTFDLVVNSLPTATELNMANTLEVCDNDDDGSAINGFVQNINLDDQTATILGSQDPANYIVTYHTSLALAQANGTAIASGTYSNQTNTDIVYVRIENRNTGCVNDTFNFTFLVNTEPLGNTPSNLSECDNDADGDDANGFVQTFDLESQIPTILGDPMVQDEDDFNVTFHLNQTDATSGNDPQSSPFTNTDQNGQTIYVRIENKATGCVNDDVTFDVIVNPLPEFSVTTPQTICLNNTPLTLVAENPNAVYTYEWFDASGTPLGASITQDVTTGGEYTVIATTTSGTMCPRALTITVEESNIATITDADVTIVDDSDNNSITINNSNLGPGNYEFALINENGIVVRDYQTYNIFEGLEGGIYTINVRDINGCGVATLTVPVVEFPKFFTPNGDGIKDTWAIKGVNPTFFPEGKIYIFNRQGKVVAEVLVDGPGWNGLYNNAPAPSNDYWFNIQLIDNQGNVRNRKGHFSLLRR